MILIGDAPANTQAEVSSNRARRKEQYWQTTRFTTPTYWEKETEILAKKQVPIYTFYVHQAARNNFAEIAQRSRGQSSYLEVNSNAGSELLTDVVTKRILTSVGGESRGKELVEQYERKFSKGYR